MLTKLSSPVQLSLIALSVVFESVISWIFHTEAIFLKVLHSDNYIVSFLNNEIRDFKLLLSYMYHIWIFHTNFFVLKVAFSWRGKVRIWKFVASLTWFLTFSVSDQLSQVLFFFRFLYATWKITEDHTKASD